MAKNLVQVKCGLPPYVVEFAKEQAEKTGLPQSQILRSMFMEGYYKLVSRQDYRTKEKNQ